MENKFNSQLELYNKLKPALRTKRHELYRGGLKIIKENDIWNYNKEAVWKNAKGLTIASMVNDILNTPTEAYENYINEKIAKMTTRANLEE